MEERNMALYLRNEWLQKGAEVKSDVMGNVYASINNDDIIHIGLVAHMDTTAIQITKILDNGLLLFRSIGLRPYLLLGQNMNILTRSGTIQGVIGFDPTSYYGQPKGLIEEDLWLDIGANNYEDASYKVEVGDLAVLSPQISEMGDDIICGTCIDDRIGIFILNECLIQFKESALSVCLHCIGTTQEEVGLRGANVIASQCKLDACFVVDVDYATDTLTPHENQMGTLHLGKGVGIHIKSDNSPILRKIICDVASKNNIPHQKSLGRFVYGGTDATAVQLQCGGVATVNINIPCRYMHSPIEFCHKKDVESAIDIIMFTIQEIADKKINNFIPL
ncbi:MAG: hypothetical protein IJY31_07730 [Muribaculaceae bacterium]|nr:hypothetical protein [Muribaculaceae bacterium]